MTPYSTCRPQLHAAGIGTWLWEDCARPFYGTLTLALKRILTLALTLALALTLTLNRLRGPGIAACWGGDRGDSVRRGDAAWANLQRAQRRQGAQRRYPQRLCGRKGGAQEGRDAFAQSGNS